VHGFALELSPTGYQHRLVSTYQGIVALYYLLKAKQPSVLVVRRCNILLWAQQRISNIHCEDANCSQVAHASVSSNKLLAEASVSKESDEAMQHLVIASGVRRFFLNHDWLRGSLPKVQLAAFLGIDLLPSTYHAARAEVESGPRFNILASDARCRSNVGPCTVAHGNCSWKRAAAVLARRTVAQRPLLAIGVHSVHGGASIIGHVVAQACKVWLTPALGIRCSFQDAHDTCDPEEVDLCFHGQARFSIGRFAERGYRFVHVVRDPVEVLVRSSLESAPSALELNTSTFVDTRLQALVAGELQDMLAINESHAYDPNYMRIRLEELEANDFGRNTALARMFSFLLDGWSSLPITASSMPSSIPIALTAALKMDANRRNQRKSVSMFLERRPAKCRHIGKIREALNYPVTPQCSP